MEKKANIKNAEKIIKIKVNIYNLFLLSKIMRNDKDRINEISIE